MPHASAARLLPPIMLVLRWRLLFAKRLPMLEFPSSYQRALRRFFRAIVFACVAFAASAFAEKGDPANLVKWRSGLTSSAQPDANYLARSKALGYEMVVNLAPPQSQGSIENEASIVGRQGVVYVNIPVNFGQPSTEDFRIFSEVMKLAAKKPVLVHCQVNLRGSAFTFLYRVIHEGAAIDETQQKLLGVWSPDPVWKTFIETMLAAHGKKVEFL